MMNKIFLTGILGKDPVIKQFENGNKRANLFLAVHDSYMNTSGRKIITTQWHRLTAWGRTADQVERMLHKGSKISLEGKLRQFQALDHNLKSKKLQEIIIDQFEIHVDIFQNELIRA